ncbi:MAG TPA: hypothetical protein EYN79_09615 [Planctomycetes bacterium]|nr:hypothetical protein [Planctomycetota bacterium]
MGSVCRRILRFLSLILPSRKNRWVFIHSEKHWHGNLRTLYDSACRDERISPCIIVTGADSVENLKALYQNRAEIFDVSGLKKYWVIPTSSAVVVSHYGNSDIHHNVINVWHGIPLKAIGILTPERTRKFKRKLRRFSSLVSSSPLDRSVMSAAFGLPPDRVIPTGLPRNDILHPNFTLPTDLKALDDSLLDDLSGKKLALFAPTFRDHRKRKKITPFTKEQVATLVDVLGRMGYSLGVRGHHTSDDMELPENTSIVDCSSSRFPEMQILLRRTDLLITDYSGCFFDFLLRDRPMVSFAHDYFDYVEGRGFTYDFRTVFPGPICTDFQQLIDILPTLVDDNHDQHYAEKRAIIRDLIVGSTDGGASKRVIEQILSQ